MVAAGATVFSLFLATGEDQQLSTQLLKTTRLLEQITGRELLTKLLAEEIGEINGEEIIFDLLVIAPCPGNFLAKLVNTSATAAPLSKTVRHLQAGLPVVLALICNGDSEEVLQNAQQIISLQNFFLVSFGPEQQGRKQVFLARLDLLYETVAMAMEKRQLEPVYLETYRFPH
ncbi:MAG: Dipicolinate synthase subunit B [Syntrophomonadaceae bacterium]|nr:Dipicolinate synthase subunit B [Bacillota bacterium]